MDLSQIYNVITNSDNSIEARDKVSIEKHGERVYVSADITDIDEAFKLLERLSKEN